MNHSIQYRGKTIDIAIDTYSKEISFVKDGNNYVLNILHPQNLGLGDSTQIKINYSITITDDAGNVLSVSQRNKILGKIKGTDTTYYAFYFNYISALTAGQMNFRGYSNMVISDFFNEAVYPFDSTEDFALVQPVIFDTAVFNKTVDVTIVNKDESSSVEYSLDNVEFQSESLFTGLNNGIYTMYVKYTTGGFAYNKTFEIAYEA